MSPSLAAEPAGRAHEVVTPEGVPLRLEVAAAGDRVGALLLDLLFIALLTAGLLLPLVALAMVSVVGVDLVLAAAVLAVFLVRTFYFVWFELAWQGQTPGKRRLGIRAVDAQGGPLSAEAILARNLTRELELFLPMIALFAPGAAFPGAPGWLALLSLGWMLAFGFLPLFNRDRLRVGDLVAGTVVIRAPAAVLLEDLSIRARAAHEFTEAQLDVYGVFELQVLEGVLRGAGQPGHDEAVRTVAEKIREKLGVEGAAGDDQAFLEAFYAALRGRLEKRLLFGRRRRSKHDRL
ncbi:MAG TPA: RDD family protein [Anaeromyxobacter sp.]|nr:RDD family protein [Anaeromyxobacter sp.]